MHNNIIFFQSTSLGGDNEAGLIDLLNLHLKQQQNLFEQISVIVPNQAMAVWVKDQLAKKNGVCANIDCIVLSGTLIDNIYRNNNPHHQLCDFGLVRYIIYQILLNSDLSAFPILIEFLANSDLTIDNLKAYELACQLEGIYHEYLYLRTDEMLNLEWSNFKDWQKFIWQQVLHTLGAQKTFLDVYKYFATVQNKLILPKNIFIFGLTSCYPSQLKILSKLSSLTNIYWYYQSCSNNYYGDLLSEKARSKIEQRLLRKPDLTIDDLYLTGGNRLLANLGQQSREFVELLRVNDVNVYEFEPKELEPVTANITLLNLVKTDIRNLVCRIRKELRLSGAADYYSDPLQLESFSATQFYDLPYQQSSIKINICHNKMREVQVMFNQLLASLAQNSELNFADILIIAPDIDDYVPYIQSVFDNEFTIDKAGNKCFLPYYITGNRRHSSFKIIESIQLMLNTPYALTVSYLLEILQDSEIQTGLAIDFKDIDLIKQWLCDNHTHFGYDELDFAALGYANYSIYGFKQLLLNLVLGSSIDEQTFLDRHSLPYLQIGDKTYVPYDNLDNAQISLANKLIVLIELLEEQRQLFYIDEYNYHKLDIADVITHLSKYALLIQDDEVSLIYDEFIGYLRSIDNMVLNLAVLIAIIKDYLTITNKRLSLSGKITCMSMQYARNLPYKYIYVLGMNFGEYPTSYQPNQLSILAKEWYLADRNYNIEDKQAFLDVILAADEQLTISYIGRKETDNSEIKPSPIVSLLLEVLGHGVTNFWDNQADLLNLKYNYLNLVETHALHPFYNNKQHNYAQIWSVISKLTGENLSSLAWDFSQDSPIKLSASQLENYLKIDIKLLINTFKYTNNNLYRTIGLSTFDNEVELVDEEPLVLYERNLAKQLYRYFENYADKYTVEDLEYYLMHKGVIGHANLGQEQFGYYHTAYKHYVAKRGQNKVNFVLTYKLQNNLGQEFKVCLNDELYVENNNVIICEEFAGLKDAELKTKFADLSYTMRLRGLITYALISQATQFTEKHNIKKVILRQLNVRGESVDFSLSIDDPSVVLQNILKFYVRSLTNPVLIHEAAIVSYAKEADNDAKAELNVLQNFYNDFNNTGLDKIKQDPIYTNIVEDYFSLVKFNDIYFIGKLLAQLEGIK